MKHDQEQILCVIPARAGSTRIPGKNLKPFHGKPIIEYSIAAALDSQLFGEIVVSTDSRETVALAERMGVTGEYRFENLCANEVGTQRVARSVLQTARLGRHLVCVIYATAPLMCVSDLKRGLQMLRDIPQLEFTYSVGNVDEVEVDAGQFYWSRAISLLAHRELDVAPTGHVVIHPGRMCDINTPEDWERAEKMYVDLEGMRL